MSSAEKLVLKHVPTSHLFATSADILDTATAIRFKTLIADVIVPDMIALEKQLIALAREHADTPQIRKNTRTTRRTDYLWLRVGTLCQ